MKIQHALAIAATTVGLGLLAPNAQAALITGVTATTNMGTRDFSFSLPATVNGGGLPGDIPSLTGLHDGTFSNNVWLSAPNVLTGNITFDLGASYNLAGFSFWNFGTNTIAGINGVTVQTSTDGVNFISVPGGPTTFAEASGNFNSPEVFSFSPVVASSVRFVVSSNYGATFASGFAEAHFNSFDAPVVSTPEPGSILGLLAVGGGLLASRRKKQG